jgi:hypothetical protein
MTGIAWLKRGVPRMLLGLTLAVGLGVFGAMPMGAQASALGEGGGAPTETGNSPGGTSSCPSSNPPNELTLLAGTPQITTLDTAFVTGLQVALANSDGCPVTGAAGVAVTFSAPSSGPSGVFAGSGSRSVTVGSDASGAVAAPTFTANATPGSYTVEASSPYGSVSLSLTNTAAGIPARIVAIGPASRSATVAGRYRQPLQVKVLDAGGGPVAGVTVTFTLGPAGPSPCGVSSSAGAGFIGGGTQTSAATGESGVATSPLLAAGSAAGPLTATAAISSREGPTAGAGGAGSATAATAASFSLRNLPGRPAKLTAGLAATQSTPAGSRFPIRLAVTATDAERNPVPGALVTFAGPLRGAGGSFATHPPSSPHSNKATVRSNACGIALAPALTANRSEGGYIVKATLGHARPAAFALVNTFPGQSP